ncbi:1,2-phenylacetyl-CoA epoxidase subunit B [Vreelandella titanicae]
MRDETPLTTEAFLMADWPLFEVFIRSKHGLNHKHVGSVHAADRRMAIENARELYTRRNEGVSIWVVPASEITASSPDEKEPLFDPSNDKVYRHASFYKLPKEVGHM